MTELPPLYDQSDYEALREEKDKCIARSRTRCAFTA
jgi:hypothetical protein